MVLTKKVVRFYFFVSGIVCGTLIRISSADWLGVWAGLELNLFRVVPLLVGGGRSAECESSIKYFLTQACGSVLLIGRVVINGTCVGMFNVGGGIVSFVPVLVMVLGFMLKLGLVPFHYWVPRVMGGVR